MVLPNKTHHHTLLIQRVLRSASIYTPGKMEVAINPDMVRPVFLVLRDHIPFLYKLLLDVIVIDLVQSKYRFEIIYPLRSIKYFKKMLVRTYVSDLQTIYSISSIFNAANWFEREMWDMYGVFFEEHPDLRRILTDYGFDGYPLRKDFPLSGYYDVRFNHINKIVVQESIELSQEFRFYNYTNPWNILVNKWLN